MKIDIHVHTKKCKSGDAPTREVSPKKFCETVLSTDVRILCITNHNVFDLDQFREIESSLSQEAQVWPGVELDVIDGNIRGHLLVIVSPKNADQFSDTVAKITKGNDPDTFRTTIEKTLEYFDVFGPLYVAHYKQKKPDISDIAIEKLVARAKYPNRIIKEVTNSISAGIYISHGHPSIYGSDVQDWDTYESLSRNLPDIRLPVESFEHFCLLLEKDPTTINTLLDKKTSEDMVLHPFDDGTVIRLKAYNDVHVVFGSKGTGKSCLLQSISRHYCDKGIDARVYTPASDRLDEIFDTRCKNITINLEPYGINYCTDEIAAIRAARESDVTSLSNYLVYFKVKSSNKNAKKILLKDLDPEEASGPQREFIGYNKSASTTKEFIAFIEKDESARKELNSSELAEMIEKLSSLLGRLEQGKWQTFSNWKVICLLNSAISSIRNEVARKTGTPSKPSTTGFRDYALNRLRIEVNANEVLRNIDKPIQERIEPIGSLGPDKGHLDFRTETMIQNGRISDAKLLCVSGVKKGTQKNFVRAIRKIADNVYSDDLFHCIAELNEIEDIDDIKTINELLMFKRYFAINGEEYVPSSGEASMLMLQKELEDDKEVYILDEPERSLGNEYISDVIVPLIKEKAREGKKVFISTHDANIAVRTLPYSSVYRCHGPNGYATYIGNPFSNNLINVNDGRDTLDWKKISMKTLEGGEEAFGEREKIYGNN